jgi:hypothetical protein
MSDDDMIQLRALIASMTLLREDLARDRARWEQERKTDRRVRRVLSVVTVAALLIGVGLWTESDGRRDAICDNREALRRVIVQATGQGGTDFTQLETFPLQSQPVKALLRELSQSRSDRGPSPLLDLVPPC